MAMTDAERLRFLELKEKEAGQVDNSYLSNQITPSSVPGEPSFFEGIKSGLTGQPGAGVGQFIGAAIPATVGGILGGPIGAALGETARQTAGAIADPEATAKKSALGIGAEVAGAGVGQAAGPAIAKGIGKGISAVGGAVGDFSEWLGTKIGNSFLKASKKINAYGHEPVQAIKDEKIMAGSWDGLIDTVKARKHDVGQEIRVVLNKADADTLYNIDDIVSPVDKALAEAYKFPSQNTTLIPKLEGLKADTLRLLKKGADKGQVLNSERANSIKTSLYKVTKYTGADADEIPLNKVKQDIARNISNKIGEVTPEIKPLMKRYSNLSALENAVANRAVVASNSDVLGLKEAVMGAGTAAFGFGFAPGIALSLSERALRTPFGATPAVNIASGAGKAVKAITPTIAGIAESIAKRIGGGMSAATIEQIISDFTPEDIRKSYKAGEIDKADAAQMLRENHGYQ